MIGEFLALVGAVLILVSATGVVRFTDVFARLHALAKASTLGLLLLLAGAAVNLHHIYDITSVVLAGSPPPSRLPTRFEHAQPSDLLRRATPRRCRR